MSAFRSESPIGACNGVLDFTKSGSGWGHSCPVPTIDITADPAGSGALIVTPFGAGTDQSGVNNCYPSTPSIAHPWTVDGGATVTPDAAQAPDGTISAALITIGPGYKGAYSASLGTIPGLHCTSLWVRTVPGDAGGNFAIGDANTGLTNNNISVTPVWTRVYCSRSGSGYGSGVWVMGATTNSLTRILIWGVQDELGVTTPSEYHATTTAPVYWLSSTKVQNWPASSNICLQSQTIATGTSLTSPWATGDSVPVVADAAIAPDGTMTATRVDFGAISGAGQHSIIYQDYGGGSATRTLSFWARTVAGTGVLYADLWFTPYNCLACNLTTAWQRFTFTKTASGSYIQIGPDAESNSTQPSTQPALSCYIWGVQLEAKSTASPYHATVAASVSWSPGTPTTVSSPYYPLGFTRANTKAVKLNGTDSYYDLGTSGEATTDLTIACVLDSNVVADASLIAKDNLSTHRQWKLLTTGGAIYFYAFNVGGDVVYISGAFPIGSWHVVAVSYHYVTNGTSVMRMCIDGTIISAVTNAVGPLPAFTTSNLVIGADSARTSFVDGQIAHTSIWTGFAASDAQLQAMCTSMMGSLPSRGV